MLLKGIMRVKIDRPYFDFKVECGVCNSESRINDYFGKGDTTIYCTCGNRLMFVELVKISEAVFIDVSKIKY